MALNKGRHDNQNPQDNNQANTANDERINPDQEIKNNQKTESVWLRIPQVVEVNGINYGPGDVKVASEDAAKIKHADSSVTEIEQLENEHHGAKPMPKELDGPDYV